MFQRTIIGIIVLGIISSLIASAIDKNWFEDVFYHKISQQTIDTKLVQQQVRAVDDAKLLVEKAAALQRQLDDAKAAAALAEEQAKLQKIQMQRQIDAAQEQAQIEAARAQAQARAQAEEFARQQARAAAAYRASNGGCDPGTHPQCLSMGTSGNMQTIGCPCVGD